MSSPRPYRILIVDDDESLHGVFACMLAPASDFFPAARVTEPVGWLESPKPVFPSFEIDFAFQGQQGLDLIIRAQAEDRPYTMAFVDMRMPPGWDGITTIGHIWERCRNLQVVICTGHTDFSWHDLIRKFGHSDRLLILKKPFDITEVRQVAYSLAEKWDLAHQAENHLQRLQKLVDERTSKLQEANLSLQREMAKQQEAEAARSLMEMKLRHAQKMESIGQLAAGIAHEINTPTQYIGDNIRFLQTSFADLNHLHENYHRLLGAARENAVTPALIAETDFALNQMNFDFLVAEIPKAISQSLEGVERVARIVRAMKDFSHPGTKHKSFIDLNQAIETTLAVAGNEWKYVSKMVTEFDATLPPVPCFPGELNQVILNLVVNAAHAIADITADGSKSMGTITVITRRHGEWIEIHIRDTGGGIPEKIRANIFDPFFTTKPVGKGTGQGLAIAHTVIVEQHGGQLTFETEPGVGTCFIIRLPLDPITLPEP
jgi:signal transduction histidine kinase